MLADGQCSRCPHDETDNAKVVSKTLAATWRGQPNMLLLCHMRGRLTR